MKKVFPFTSPGRDRARVVESIKHDVRKYVKRERKKTPPDDFELWDFNCRVGASPETAVAKSVKELSAAIDAVAATEAPAAYVEILAVPGRRPPHLPPAPLPPP
jgi:hypothetical protein